MLRQALLQANDWLVTGWRKADPIPQKKKAPDLWHAAPVRDPTTDCGRCARTFSFILPHKYFLGLSRGDKPMLLWSIDEAS
jgi:hypothetical protein